MPVHCASPANETLATLKVGLTSTLGASVPSDGELFAPAATSPPPMKRKVVTAKKSAGGDEFFVSPAHGYLLAVEEAAAGFVLLGSRTEIPVRAFSKASKRAQSPGMTDLARWKALGVYIAHVERPAMPMGAWEFVSHRAFDAWVERSRTYAKRLEPLGGDLLRLPRLLATRLDELRGAARLHVAVNGGALRGFTSDLVAKLLDLQLVDDVDGEKMARTESDWRVLAAWMAGGHAEWAGSSFSLADFARMGARWFADADKWVAHGRQQAKRRGAPVAQPTAKDFENDTEDGEEYLRRKLMGGK